MVEPIANSKPEPTSSSTSAARRRVKCVLTWNLLRFEDDRNKRCVKCAPRPEGALLPLGRGRPSLWVAERERRDPRQIERRARRPRNDRRELRRLRPCECAYQPLDDAEKQTGEEKGEQGERQLRQQAKQEARLKRGVERKGLGSKQALAELLQREGERGQEEEQARGELAAPEAAATAEQQARPRSDDRCRREDADEEHQVAGITRARSLGHLGPVLARPRRGKEIGERMRGQRSRRHHRQSEEPRQTTTHSRQGYAHWLHPVCPLPAGATDQAIVTRFKCLLMPL